MQNFKFNLTVESNENRYTELHRTYIAFYNTPKTMRMVEVETGILRPNICRYVALLEDLGLIQKIRNGYCPYTHHRAGFYSSNPVTYNRKKIASQLLLEFKTPSLY